MTYEESLIERYKNVRARLFAPRKMAQMTPAPFSGMPKEPPPAPVKKVRKIEPVSVKVKILQDELERLGETKESLFNDCRTHESVVKRREIWHKMRECGYSFNQIARICRPENPYDHTTIMHGIKKHNEWLQQNEPKT